MSKLKVCLTGGIASGKTYVSDKLAQLGAHIIDADVLARQVVEKGTEGLVKIVDNFGSSVLNSDGSLNRGKLKATVFSDNRHLEKLNSILHPLILKSFEKQSNLNHAELEIWVIPLLKKASGYVGFDRILAVDVKSNIQINRVKARDRNSHEVAISIINSQPSRQDRLTLASDVITNNKDFAALDVSILHAFNLFKNIINRE